MSDRTGHNLTVVQQKSSTPSDLGIFIEKPKFPQYAVYSKRVESFEKWPEYLPVNIKDLVEAGLVFTGVGDSVRCYHCGGGLRNWERGDVPMEEHAKWYPKCPHVLLVKGQTYVDKVGKGENLETVLASKQIQEQTTETDMMESMAVKSCLQMDFAEDLVKAAVKLFIKRHGHTDFKATDIAQLYFEIEDHPELVNRELNGKNDTDAHKNVDCTLKYEDLSESDESIKELQEENQRLKEYHLCKVCLDKVADVIFLPCGHMTCCPQCAPAMSKCPICRKVVNGQLKAFFAVANDQAC